MYIYCTGPYIQPIEQPCIENEILQFDLLLEKQNKTNKSV